MASQLVVGLDPVEQCFPGSVVLVAEADEIVADWTEVGDLRLDAGQMAPPIVDSIRAQGTDSANPPGRVLRWRGELMKGREIVPLAEKRQAFHKVALGGLRRVHQVLVPDYHEPGVIVESIREVRGEGF